MFSFRASRVNSFNLSYTSTFHLLGEPEDEVDGFEIIETSRAKNLAEQLITMDLWERPPMQQIAIGGMSGWYVLH